jgi:hypothetical protein
VALRERTAVGKQKVEGNISVARALHSTINPYRRRTAAFPWPSVDVFDNNGPLPYSSLTDDRFSWAMTEQEGFAPGVNQ